MAVFNGSGVALVTPFNVNGIDEACLKKMISFHLSESTDALIVCGTTGEPTTMTREEQDFVITTAVESVSSRIPVIVGTGSNSTEVAIQNSVRAEHLGADALLIVTPYYNKCNQDGLYEHYKSIANHVHIPIITYNVPARTGVNIDPKTMVRLATIDNIVGIKEASGNIEQIMEIARLCPDIDLYCGNDDHVMPLLGLGFSGVISVVANVAPKLVHEMVASYFDGNISKSRDIQFILNPLVKELFSDINPIPVKAAMNMMGFKVGSPRLPLTELSDEKKTSLRREMQKLGII